MGDIHVTRELLLGILRGELPAELLGQVAAPEAASRPLDPAGAVLLLQREEIAKVPLGPPMLRLHPG